MMIKKIVTPFFLTLAVICLCSFSIKDGGPKQKQKLRRIVIDPGHGGHDSGAAGKYSTEKAVSLAVALKLEEELKEMMPDVEIIMTRRTDVFDNVIVKAEKANDAKGDLFIAIHCNSASGKRHSEIVGYKTVTRGKGKKKRTTKVPQYRYWTSPSETKGTETYIWAVKKTDQKEKALKSHEDLFIDSINADALKDFDPNDPTKAIMYSLKTKQYFDRSANLALTVEEEFTKSGRFSRGAKQRNEKGIWVLQAVAMPAILVETGFISNPEEEDYLNSKEGQQEIASDIAKAVKRYRYTLENKGIKPAVLPADSTLSK